jgi:hypothetical protein
LIVNVRDPIDDRDVIDVGEDGVLEDADMEGVGRVGGEVVLGFEAAVEHVGDRDWA